MCAREENQSSFCLTPGPCRNVLSSLSLMNPGFDMGLDAAKALPVSVLQAANTSVETFNLRLQSEYIFQGFVILSLFMSVYIQNSYPNNPVES